jgi:hypothetical protein
MAALVSPWVVVPIVALASQGGPHLSKWELLASGSIYGVLFALPFAYFAVLLVGYPSYKVLLQAGWLSGWSLCSVGGGAGAILGYAFVGIEAVALSATCGFAIAFVAWWILRKDLLKAKSGDGGAAGTNNSLERTRDG